MVLARFYNRGVVQGSGGVCCWFLGKGVRMGSSPQDRTVRWVVVAFLAAIAGGLVVELWRGAPAVAQNRAADSRSLQAIPGQIGRDAYGVFLVDNESGRMAVYELLPDGKAGRKLRLVAARNVAYDLRLDDYNNADPLPRDVRTLVEQQASLENAAP